MKISENKIPTLKKEVISFFKNEKTLDCFLGFNDSSKKEKFISMIKSEMSEYENFNIYDEFRFGVDFVSLSYYLVDNVMIYENLSTNNYNKLLLDGKGKEEFILWISANLKKQ